MGQGPGNYYQEVIDPRNPLGPKIKVVIPHYIYNRAFKYNPVKYSNLMAAKEVLENPKRIFWGIREHNEGGWCYVGLPTKLCVRPDEWIDYPDDKVFAVYVNSEMIVFDWITEYLDDENDMSPRGWKERYRSLIWKSTS